MSSFGFEHPWVLGLILVAIFCSIKCKALESALIFPHLNILKKIQRKKAFFIEFLKYSSLFLLIVSLAGPIKYDNSVTIKNIGYDIALVVDVSGSMKERGFDKKDPSKSKFEVVKELMKSFISKRLSDNIALVVFGSFAYTASALTYDKDTLKKILEFLQIGIAGQKSAILDAIAQGVSLLKKGEAKSKILILLTDGIDTASKIPLDIVLKMVNKHKIKVYTIGIGNKEFINIPLLEKIAKKSGGEFFYAQDALSLKDVYAKIEKLEKSKIKGEEIIKKDHLYIYTLFFAVLMLLAYIYIYGRRGI